MLIEKDTKEAAETPEKKRKRTPPRRPRKQHVVADDSPDLGEVNVKADFKLPVANFARLAQGSDVFEEEDNEEENDEEMAEEDPTDRLHQMSGIGANRFHAPTLDSMDADAIREHLREMNEAAAFKARVWSVPPVFAERNPLINKKPQISPGWAMRGDIAYNPDTLESDLLTLFADGHYFVEIRERGQFRRGQMVTIGSPSALDAARPIAPVIGHDPAPHPDPIKEAKAQATMIETFSSAIARLLEAQTMQQPVQKPPSLKERLEEIKVLQSMFAPPQTVAPPPPPDPLEKLASALEGETLKRILGAFKNENPIALPEPTVNIWNVVTDTLPHLAPGLNSLLAGVGAWLQSLATVPQKPSPNTSPASRRAPVRNAVTRPMIEKENKNTQEEEPDTIKTGQEADAMSIQFLVENLMANTPPDQAAEQIKEMLRTKPFARTFLNQYLATENAIIWESLIKLCETPADAALLHQGLTACPWKDEWLNALKSHLQ